MKTVSIHIVLFLCFIFNWLNAFPEQGALVRYTTLPGAVNSQYYKVTINEQEVYAEHFKDVSYVRFAFSGSVEVNVKVSQHFEKFSLSPLGYKISSHKSGNSIDFTLDSPLRLILQIDGIPEKLFILSDLPEINPPRIGDENVVNALDYVSDNTGQSVQTNAIQKVIDELAATGGGILYFPKGKYLTGTFAIKTNVHLYLESGALIQGTDNLEDYNDWGYNETGMPETGKGALIWFADAENARISGRGSVGMEGTKIKQSTGVKIRICNLVNCSQSGIYDILLRDSGGFSIHIRNSTNTTMSGYKIVNDLSLPNQDGTDPDGCKNVVIDNVFMYTSDDGVAVKADFQPCQNISVENCVIWTKKSALKVGSNAYLGATNIAFLNNHIVHADRALALYTSTGIVENVIFSNNTSEFVGGDAKRQLVVFQVSNHRENDPSELRKGIGEIQNVEVLNYYAFENSENKSLVSGTVSRKGTIHFVSNVIFKNINLEGKQCLTPEEAFMILSPLILPIDPNLRKGISLQHRPEDVCTVKNIKFK